jgi:hypothetical protein
MAKIPKPKHSLPALVLVGLTLAACGPDTSQVIMVDTLQHPNGLISMRPVEMQTWSSASGFEFSESQNSRTPLYFSLTLLPPASKTPEIPRHYFGFFGMRYRVTTGESGSGGTEYQLEAARPVGNCWLLLKASKQSESFQPSFLVAWAVFNKSDVSAKAGC